MDKEALRAQYKERRLALTDFEVRSADQGILRVLQSLDYREVRYLHIYLPIERWREYNTYTFIDWISNEHPSVRLVASKSFTDTGLLRHFVLDNSTIIADNKWGIPEPANERDLIEINPIDLDMVFVPLLVCDRYGNRIGYGKGFYDRFLIQCRSDTMKVGVSYFEPMDGAIVSDPWDVPLDGLISPVEMVEFKQ